MPFFVLFDFVFVFADTRPIDIVISHDWPSGITDFGDEEALVKKKEHLAEDIKKCRLGNPATMTLLTVSLCRFSSVLHFLV